MSAAPRFLGFRAGSHATAIPNSFFADVLPLVEDPIELVVSVYAFYALSRRRAGERWLTVESLAAEASLRTALGRLAADPDEALARGLAAAVARGTLAMNRETAPVRYAINSAGGRRALLIAGAAAMEPPPEPAGTPPNIYVLYEESIGTVSPLIAEELRAAEEEFPAGWIEDAFREAAAQNRRSWRYVQRILERWRDEGRHDAAFGRDPGTRRDLAGRYRGLIQR